MGDFKGRCLRRRCKFHVEGGTEQDVSDRLDAHVRSAHRLLGAPIEIERPVAQWTRKQGWTK